MTRLWVLALVIALSSPAIAESKKTKKKPAAKQTKTAPAKSAAESPVPAKPTAPAKAPGRKEIDEAESTYYSYKLNTFLGINILRSSAFTVGAQFGLALDKSGTWYGGPEATFGLFSPGNLLTFLAGTWYEMRVHGAPKLSLVIGALAGPAFPSSLPGYGSLTYAAYVDTAIVQDIDDLVSVRGQFRPGVVGRYFSFMMNFSVMFRFL